MKTAIKRKIGSREYSFYMPDEAKDCYFKSHNLRLNKFDILGVRGMAIGNTDNHPDHYLTIKCTDCNKNFGTVEETNHE